jgi:hypothetical protein
MGYVKPINLIAGWGLARAAILPWSEAWCPGQDSNLHALRHTPLKRVCLPIPPPGQLQTEEGALRGIGFAL